MRPPNEPARIEPDAVYDDGALVLTLGLTHAAISRARRRGDLRYAREGRRVLYRGQWIIDWLESRGQRMAREGLRHD